MNLFDLRTAFRRETGDLKPKYLWSDDEVDRYLNEAADDAARRSGLLVDSTSEATEYPINAGEFIVDLHPSVVYVRRARLDGNRGALYPRVARAMDEDAPGWEDALPSTPMIFVPDWESGKLRLYPPASSSMALRLTVVRTPLSPMTNDCDAPELPSRTHYSLVYGAMEKGYLKSDADAFDPGASARAGERFAAEFGPPVSAMDEHWAIEQYYDIGHR